MFRRGAGSYGPEARVTADSLRRGYQDGLRGCLGLHVGNGGAGRLFEMHFGAQQQCAEEQVREGQHDVEIFPHVAVMQQVVSVEAEENSGAFDVAFAREVHAPMHVFIGAIVAGAGNEGTDGKSGAFQKDGTNHKRNDAHGDDRRAIPPRHGNGVFVFLIDEVIGLVRLKDVMVDQGVALEGITEKLHRLVHDVAVKRPFKKRGENCSDHETDRSPEEKM